MHAGRVVPVSMNAYRTAADFTRYLIPCAVLAVVWYVVPVLMILDGVAAVSASFFVPLRAFSLAAFLVDHGRVAPPPVYHQFAAANLASLRDPRAVLAVPDVPCQEA